MTVFSYIEINLAGLIILGMIYVNIRKTSDSTPDQRLFRYLIIAIAAELVFDSGMWLIDGTAFFFSRGLNLLFSSVYYLMMPLIGLIWLLYCDYELYEGSARLRRKVRLYSLPLILSVVMILINVFTGWVFYITEDNIYTRGTLFLLQIAIAFFYLIYPTALALHRARRENISVMRQEYLVLVKFPIIPIIGGVIQLMFYGVSLLWLCVVISIIMVFINLQNYQISVDSLTGINNRRKFDRFIVSKTKNPPSGARLALIIIDVDDFKKINDKFGHCIGDEALVNVADILKKVCAGKSDFLARYGGDEFAILCEIDDKADAEKIIGQINKETSAFNERYRKDYILTFSMGYAVFGEDGIATLDEFLSSADREMYISKGVALFPQKKHH